MLVGHELVAIYIMQRTCEKRQKWWKDVLYMCVYVYVNVNFGV